MRPALLAAITLAVAACSGASSTEPSVPALRAGAGVITITVKASGIATFNAFKPGFAEVIRFAWVDFKFENPAGVACTVDFTSNIAPMTVTGSRTERLITNNFRGVGKVFGYLTCLGYPFPGFVEPRVEFVVVNL